MIASADLLRSRSVRFRGSAAVASLLSALMTASHARACPNCSLGRQARLLFFDDRFVLHLSAASLPFLAVGGVAALISALGRRGPDATTETSR